MGADFVIAVDLGSDILGRHLRHDRANGGPAEVVGDWIRKLQDNVGSPVVARPPEQPALPTLPEVVASSINIMQFRIARSRMAGEPPDILVTPRLAHLRLLDFHRAKEAIEEGRRAVGRVAHALAPCSRSAP
jgi:NTE family protein